MKILHLEDNRRDAKLVSDLLGSELPDLEITSVSTQPEFLNALRHGGCDIVLSDYQLPGFSGRDALALVREHQPDVPFIFLSGTVGEDTAAELVREGAADYLLKDRMQRLPLALQRALEDRIDRRRRQEAEERIREQAELLDMARDGIVVTDLSWGIVYFNQGAKRIFGWADADPVGRNLVTLFAEVMKPKLEMIEQKLSTDGEWRGELPIAGKTDKPLVAEFRTTEVCDAEGRPKSYLHIITDITEKKELEEQFLRAQRMEGLGMLAAGISHDLNNALAPMLMACDLLRRRITDPADLRVLGMLEQGAGRSAALVKQILSFAAGGRQERVLIQMKHVLRDIVQLMEDTFPKSIRLEHEIPNSLWTVQGNPTQIHQVLLNLCINARDAMLQGGLLRLRAYNQTLSGDEARVLADTIAGEFLVIELADSGTGISPEILPRIWDPFFTTKGEGIGTGLGLSTVRGIVANHGGAVSIDSKMGRGSIFRVFLPAAEQLRHEQSPALSKHPFAVQGHNERVLVVDDNVAVRESIGAVLSSAGFRPLVVSDGIEVLAKHSHRLGDVSLLITDIDMPGLDGIAFSQAVLHLNPNVKVLIITGGSESSEVQQARASIGAAFLGKPFSPESLLSKVAELLRPKEGA